MNDLPSGERDAVIHEIRLACERTDAPTLHTLLSPDVVALIDTGGDLLASTRPLVGVTDVGDALLTTLGNADVTEHQVNGVCALVARRGGRVVGIVSLEVRDGMAVRVWITLSPLKLQRWNN